MCSLFLTEYLPGREEDALDEQINLQGLRNLLEQGATEEELDAALDKTFAQRRHDLVRRSMSMRRFNKQHPALKGYKEVGLRNILRARLRRMLFFRGAPDSESGTF